MQNTQAGTSFSPFLHSSGVGKVLPKSSVELSVLFANVEAAIGLIADDDVDVDVDEVMTEVDKDDADPLLADELREL